jgi:aldose sugar dehydrogenase
VHGEGGLLGLAVDPGFGISNQFVYACYDTVVDIRVMRFTTDLSPNSLAVDGAVVFGMPVNTATGRHSGCRPRFRPGTNQLFIGTGDTATDGTIPQNLHSLGGKVLCVTIDGNPCSNNPGVVNPSFDMDARIWSWGHRNVQGIAFSATSGAAYTIEHGTGRDDELNVMVQGNFGWDPGPFFYDESHPMTFPGGIEAVWSSGNPTIAPSGGTILSGSQWKGWQGAAAIAVLKGQHLMVMFFDGGLGFSLAGTTTTMRGAGRLRSAVQGPDGNLYVSTDNGGGTDAILRAVPS